MTHNTRKTYNQQISVQLKPGDTIHLFKRGRGYILQDTVTQHNTKTALISFEDTDIGAARFRDLLSGADRIEIIK